MTQPIDDRGGAKPAGPSPASPGPPAPPNPAVSPQPVPTAPALSAAEVQEVVEEGRRRFAASFPGRFELLSVLIETAGGGDTDALVDLRHTAHRLVGRAGATQFLRLAQHAAALETIATPDPGAAFDAAAASRLLGEIWGAFTEERSQVAAKAQASAVLPVEARQTVLIADDDEDQHYLMSRLLHRAGFKVAVVTKGAEVFAQAQSVKPAVILLDVQMPDQDGFTTARQLKGHPETAGIPLMFLTGRSTVDDRLAGLRIGADDYVSKSVDPRELVLRVQKLCDRVPAPMAPAAAAAEPEAPAATPARPTLVAPRPPDRPWLSREAFRDRVRDLVIRTWGALVLIRAPSESVSVGQWLAEHMRRRDLVGETESGEWVLFLPEETSSGLAARLTDLLDRLKLTISASVAAGLAGSTAPGAVFETLLEQADQALAHARSRGQLLVEYSHAGTAGAAPMVLLTDDDPEVTRITDAHVRAGGYRTQLAFDGEAALQAIREQRPDAIVLDLMLPKRTGFDVLAELRQMPAPRPSVLVLSARGREEDVTRAFALGADDYMIKPFSPQELIARLGRLLR
jgi:two-component system, cell cycle response regulator